MEAWKRAGIFLTPLVVFAALVWANISEWRTASDLGRKLAESQATALADEICLRLRSLLKERVNDLALLANSWTATPEQRRNEVFLSQAEAMAGREPSFHVINFVGPDSVVRLSAPRGKQPELVGLNLAGLPKRAALHKKVRQSGEPMASPLMTLTAGRPGMVVWYPVGSGDDCLGMVAGAILLESMIRGSVPATSDDFKVDLLIDGQGVYRAADPESNGGTLLTVSRDVDVLGRDLAVRVSPRSKGRLGSLLGEEDFHLAVNMSMSALVSIFLGLALFGLVRLKRNQESLVAAKAELKRERDVLLGLLDNIPLGVVLWGADRRLLSVNKGFVVLTGYDAKDIVTGDDWYNLAYPDPEYQAMVRGEWQRVAARREHVVREFKVRCRNEMVKDVEFRAVFLADGRFLLTLADVTERRRSREALEAARDKAESASRAKSEFLANMSHELRTPLNGIMTYLQVMARRKTENKDDARHLEMTIQAGRGLTRLLGDILSLSSMEVGRLSLEAEPFSPAEVLGGVGRAFAARCEEKGLALTVRANGLPPQVVGDAARLHQILFNLVGNAVKFTDRGDVRVAACRLPHAPPGRVSVLFTVADTGPGVDEDHFDELCEPFNQAATGFTRSHQGAGLGLGIVKRLARMMGGGVCVESPPDGGAIFYCSLNFGTVAAPNANPAILEGAGVLLVEDERVSAIALAEMLRMNGCVVTVAGNGAEALEALRGRDFDCVLMDVSMPVMGGEEAMRRIRAGEAGEAAVHVPILALTSHDMPGDRERFLSGGMDGYAAKPVTETELAAAVARLLAGRV